MVQHLHLNGGKTFSHLSCSHVCDSVGIKRVAATVWRNLSASEEAGRRVCGSARDKQGEAGSSGVLEEDSGREPST